MSEVVVDPAVFSMRAEHCEGETTLLLKTADRSVAHGCMNFTSLYEGDVLLQLLYDQFNHPNADDTSYREGVLNMMFDLLRASANGQAFSGPKCHPPIGRPYELTFMKALHLVETNMGLRCFDVIESTARLNWYGEFEEFYSDRLGP